MSGRLEPAYFDELYQRSTDPWDFETSAYEHEKYERTLSAVGPGPFRRALEVGCSIGVFTALLAPRCRELVAVDVSERALAQARERLGDLPHVQVERRDLPAEMPPGDFDLIVCSEVLYYWDRDLLVEALGRFEAALRPRGRLVAVHWRPRTESYPLQGDDVHAILAESLRLDHTLAEREDRYRLDRFDRPA